MTRLRKPIRWDLTRFAEGLKTSPSSVADIDNEQADVFTNLTNPP